MTTPREPTARPPVMPLFEQLRAQADVLVPVLRALRAELGAERAETLVFEALRRGLRASLQAAARMLPPGSPLACWRMMIAYVNQRIGADVEMRTLAEDATTLRSEVTRCRYAEHFRELGEPALGHVLACEADFVLVEQIGAPEVSLERRGTLMTGADRCDFLYRFRPGGRSG